MQSNFLLNQIDASMKSVQQEVYYFKGRPEKSTRKKTSSTRVVYYVVQGQIEAMDISLPYILYMYPEIIIVKPFWSLAILQTKNAFGLEKKVCWQRDLWRNHVCFTPLCQTRIPLFPTDFCLYSMNTIHIATAPLL